MDAEQRKGEPRLVRISILRRRCAVVYDRAADVGGRDESRDEQGHTQRDATAGKRAGNGVR